MIGTQERIEQLQTVFILFIKPLSPLLRASMKVTKRWGLASGGTDQSLMSSSVSTPSTSLLPESELCERSVGGTILSMSLEGRTASNVGIKGCLPVH